MLLVIERVQKNLHDLMYGECVETAVDGSDEDALVDVDRVVVERMLVDDLHTLM